MLVGNRKHIPSFYRVIETGVGIWEKEKCCRNTRLLVRVSAAFSSYRDTIFNRRISA